MDSSEGLGDVVPAMGLICKIVSAGEMDSAIYSIYATTSAVGTVHFQKKKNFYAPYSNEHLSILRAHWKMKPYGRGTVSG